LRRPPDPWRPPSMASEPSTSLITPLTLLKSQTPDIFGLVQDEQERKKQE
jgi:hypothetical protein